jgi:hypothetical protein
MQQYPRSRQVQCFSYFKPTFYKTYAQKIENITLVVLKNLLKWTLHMHFFYIIDIK